MGKLNRLTRLFHWVRRSFWLMPMLGCVFGCILAIAAHAGDDTGLLDGLTLPGDALSIGEATVRTLLGTIAGATATMMSLTYSLTLLVFTLAAGQLGPRLLDSFYDNRANQITISVLGASFVYMLVGMFLLSEDQDARVTGILAITLAIIALVTLILFVHDVSQRVLVDNEIARTAKRLRHAIAGAFRLPDKGPQPRSILPDRDTGAAMVLHACDTGYLRSIDLEELVKDMAEHDALVEIVVAPGAYVVERMPVALVHRAGSVEDWDKTIYERLVLGPSRSSEGDVLFSVNLLIEIALRALSPGINDSFTAISVIDHLSGAFGDLLHRKPSSPLYLDEDGTARVMASVLSIEEIVDTALHPIRRNAAGNMLVGCALIAAIERMIAVSAPEHVPMLRSHADLVGRSALPPDAMEEDRRYLAARLLVVSPETP